MTESDDRRTSGLRQTGVVGNTENEIAEVMRLAQRAVELGKDELSRSPPADGR